MIGPSDLGDRTLTARWVKNTADDTDKDRDKTDQDKTDQDKSDQDQDKSDQGKSDQDKSDQDGGKDGGNADPKFDPNGGKMPDGWTGEDGRLPVPTRDGYRFDGWYDDEGNLVTSLGQAYGKTLHARWTRLDGLASTGADGLAAGLTALALMGAGLTIGAVRRRRSR